VRIAAGATVAEGCLILPGCTLGTNCELGSGGLGPEGATLPENTRWVGCRDGAPVEVPSQMDPFSARRTTIKPFGKAFYEGAAPYTVWPYALHILYSLAWAPVTGSEEKHLTLLTLLAFWAAEGHERVSEAPFTACVVYLALCSAVHTAIVTSMLVLDVVAQALIIGPRVAGSQGWDRTSYCQRSLLHRRVRLQAQRKLAYLQGSPMLCSYFRWCGAKIGRGVCLHPAGATPMMNEPDLVTIGEGACIDDCSLLCRSNAQGEMRLQEVTIGSMATCRRRTCVLAGGAMGSRSELLEHTLVLPGDAVPSCEAWQGWPARSFYAVDQVPQEVSPGPRLHRVPEEVEDVSTAKKQRGSG